MTIDKRMSSGGEDTKQMNMKTFIKLADKEKIEADALNDLFKEIEDKFREQGKPSETITDFIKRIDVSELKRIELKSGGKVLNFSDYKDLQRIAENLLQKKNCFRLLNGEQPLKKISILYAIGVLITDKINEMNRFELQDNGRNIWEQTEKKLLQTYSSKGGLITNETK